MSELKPAPYYSPIIRCAWCGLERPGLGAYSLDDDDVERVCGACYYERVVNAC